MWYNRRYENTHFYSTIHRGRTTPSQVGLRSSDAFVLRRCQILLASARGERLCDRPPTGLRRPDRAQRDPRLQCGGAGRPARRVFAPPSLAHGLLARRSRAVERPAASQPPRFRPGSQHLDLRTGGPSQLRARDHRRRGLRRECAPSAKRLKTNWKRAKHWITSPDPQYLLKKTPATA